MDGAGMIPAEKLTVGYEVMNHEYWPHVSWAPSPGLFPQGHILTANHKAGEIQAAAKGFRDNGAFH